MRKGFEISREMVSRLCNKYNFPGNNVDPKRMGDDFMVHVYYYIPKDKVDNVIDCGLKLSAWYDREVPVKGEVRKCISALLNPRDDREKYKSLDFKCLKIGIESQYCYVADRYLYEAAQKSETIMELYIKTIIPVEQYIFGMYRLPECLILSTVMAEQMAVADKGMDYPVLFESSEKLYTSNILEGYREENDHFNDVLLYYFYNKLAEFKKVDKIEDKEKRMAVFYDNNSGKTFCIRIPEEEAAEA